MLIGTRILVGCSLLQVRNLKELDDVDEDDEVKDRPPPPHPGVLQQRVRK
jgi:hypothetical protein